MAVGHEAHSLRVAFPGAELIAQPMVLIQDRLGVYRRADTDDDMTVTRLPNGWSLSQ